MFTVETAKTKNISILKDLIKEKKDSQLKDVDATSGRSTFPLTWMIFLPRISQLMDLS
jgi:hypothetical protein